MQYVEIKNGQAFIAVKGEARITVSSAIRDEMEEAVEKGCRKFVFDFADTTFMDSVGVANLPLALKLVGGLKENVIIRNPKGDVLRLLQSTRMLEEVTVE